MKKIIIISIMIIMAISIYGQQDSTDQKSTPKDSITQLDIAKHIYLTSIDWSQFLMQYFNDSIPITEFYGKPIDGEFWKSKGRYYWDPWDPLPVGVKYLKRRPTWPGYTEFMTIKYRQK